MIKTTNSRGLLVLVWLNSSSESESSTSRYVDVPVVLMASIVQLVENQYEFDETDTTVPYHEEIRLKLMIKLYFPWVTINRIEKLNNKFLYASFMLKKNEKRNYNVTELIHATAASNVHSIERDNLDWRRVQRAKYGYGVSFSRNADYANYHSSWTGGSQKAFIICDVLVGDLALTNSCATIPAGKCDTHRSTNGHVYVKYEDFTFYPKYALYYDKPDDRLSKFNRNRRGRRFWYPYVFDFMFTYEYIRILRREKINSSENAEEINVAIEPSQVLEVEVEVPINPIIKINSNLDNCNEKEADAVEENSSSSQSVENCEINVNPDYETVPAAITSEDLNEEKKAETPEEIVKKILSTENINQADLNKRVLLTFETDIVDLISKTCQFDESKLISHYQKNSLIRMVTNSFPKVKIDKVEKLSNKYLYAAFMLKKNEKKNYRIIELIHSTAAENVSSIERENLDWRRVYRAKYGKGVSFSSNADYANYHSSWSGGNRRAFVICDVLAASETRVDDNQKEAPEGKVDIFKSRNGHVYVKFDDFTIYPKYALYYDKPPSEQSKFYRKRKYFTFDNSDSDDGF
ncbi:uncharacterized protein LOC135840673 [Planococcus citri]|uniref:uncharacterized protein LOC135840673 n=1 Tax=Planococcus citri TaxID=170843 RepID=UPI0031F78414